ncbi:MAG: PepSY1/2 domain-containing protein [Bacillota bacterium]
MEKKKITYKIITYSVATLVIVGLSLTLAFAVERQNQYRIDLENIYEKSYYDTMASVYNIETNMEKLSIAEGDTMQRKLLNSIWRECELAENNLAQLSTDSESVDQIIKFINQMGDYCHYLSNKLEEFDISEEENQNLDSLAELLRELKTNLISIQEELMSGGRILGPYGQEVNYFSDAFHKMNHTTIEYPHLLYDGPFSEARNERTPIALEGLQNYTQEEGQELLQEHFPHDNLEIEYMGEVTGTIPAYLYNISAGELSGSVELTKQGGYILIYNSFKSIRDPNLGEDECIEKAEEFIEDIGYENMEPVWVTNNHSTLYINFAYVQDDVIIYPDLIKIKVAADNGEIIGVEARNYIFNHKQRQLDIPNEIDYSPNNGTTVVKENLALIPTEWNTEVLSKEYVVTKDEKTYIIYVNVDSLEEEKILMVINDEGQMLI